MPISMKELEDRLDAADRHIDAVRVLIVELIADAAKANPDKWSELGRRAKAIAEGHEEFDGMFGKIECEVGVVADVAELIDDGTN